MDIPVRDVSGTRWSDFDTRDAAQVEAWSASFRDASPFPHIVVDGLFPVEMLRTIAGEFYSIGSPYWREYRNALMTKRGTWADAPLPPVTQDFFNVMNSGPFIRLLSRITGIQNLLPDPSLDGGGMHEVDSGGSFAVHTDFTTHPRTGLTNRMAVITYLNDGWTPEDGGQLELWSKEPLRSCGSVVPLMGRTIIMEQSDRAAHGHPNPVGEGLHRRSIMAYYYTNTPPTGAGVRVPDTEFIAAAGLTPRQRAELFARKSLPPVMIAGLKAVRNLARGRS